jgi:(2Fe-2S) ferredoxin
MYWTKRHVLVCTANHCAQKGANEVVGKLRLDIVRKGLDAEILVNTCGTIDLCDMGPNLVVYPDNVILRGVTVRDLPRVVDYLRGGDLPADLVVGPASADEMARRAFYDAAARSPRAVEAFDALLAAHGFDAAWSAEQQRRGFIARKPDPDGQPTVSVTKKARDRYRLST